MDPLSALALQVVLPVAFLSALHRVVRKAVAGNAVADRAPWRGTGR